MTEAPTRNDLDELREQVALRVMGGRRVMWDARPGNYFILMPGAPNWDNPHVIEPAEGTPPFDDYLRDVPNYPSDLAAAWSVVEKIKAMSYNPLARPFGDFARILTYNSGYQVLLWHLSPETICRAAVQVCLP